MLSAVQNTENMGQAIGNTSDARMQALGVAAAGLNAYNTYKSLTDNAGNFSPEKAASISVNVSIGSSQSQSNTSSESNTARGSTVAAGNNVNITATGAGVDSNLTVQGSSITAGNSATLSADNQVNLLAAQNTASNSSTNSNSSAGMGVSYGIGQGGAGFGFNASASSGKGSSNGSDSSFTNTSISAGNTASLTSGGDTNLKGAVVAANTVIADVGGNLNIQSLQDTSTYNSQQSSAGGSVSFGSSGNGGGISVSQSKIDSTFASVGQQSGIKAGDGGFQVNVGNNTALTGGVISSTQAAVDQNKNTFTTGGTLSTSDIQNSASFNGSAFGVSVDAGTQPGKLGVNGVGVGIGSDKGEASSVTTAGISGVAGNTAVRTGDAETGLKPIFDAAKVQAEINAQVAISQAFTKEAPKAVASYSQAKYDELKDTNPEEAKKWSEGGVYRIALHTLMGGLSGGVGGAAGAVASASAANIMNDLQDSIAQSLQGSGLSADAAKSVAQVIASLTAAGVGAAVGGAQGAATGLTVDANNRQLHPTEIQWIKFNANRYASQKGISVADAEKQLAEQAFRQVQYAAEGGAPAWDVNALNFLKTAGTQALPDGGYLFYATPEQRANSLMYIGSVVTNAAFYAANQLTQPSRADVEKAAVRDYQIRANLNTATNTAFAASATIALVGLAPTVLNWVLANPIEAQTVGLITAETAAAITSGAVTPGSLVQVAPQKYGPLASAAIEKFGETQLTNAGRALTKHPEILDLTKNTLRQQVATEAELNRVAESVINNILIEGVKTTPILPRYGAVTQIQIPGGFGARWSADGTFIGFINP